MSNKQNEFEIIKYGVHLTRLRHEDIEMVRNWRNSPEIANNMAFRDHITPEMQEKWFSSIENSNNFYFLVNVQRKPIGLVNLKNVDYDRLDAEGGAFIGIPEAAEAFSGLRAALAIYDFGFEAIGLKSIYIHVLRDNIGAIRLNKMIGFIEEPTPKNSHLLAFRVTSEQYNLATKTLKQRFI